MKKLIVLIAVMALMVGSAFAADFATKPVTMTILNYATIEWTSGDFDFGPLALTDNGPHESLPLTCGFAVTHNYPVGVQYSAVDPDAHCWIIPQGTYQFPNLAAGQQFLNLTLKIGYDWMAPTNPPAGSVTMTIVAATP
jgi:hypothetical protein